jgi:hypothetical protein
MTTQYTTILKLALPVQGELSGTWGDVVNDNITQMVEQAVAGKAVINTWTANSHTLTTADGTTSESRCAILELTDSGTALTAAGTVVCPTNTKLYIVDNNTAEIITVQTAAGTGVAVPVGKTMLVYCDGTNVVEGVTHANSLSLGTSTNTVNAISIATDLGAGSSSDSNLPTQLAVKTYVDGQIAATNELSEVLAAGNVTGANDIDVENAQKVQFRDAAIYLNSSVDGQLDIVADTEIQIDTALVDINGNLDVSGTTNISGSVSFTKNAIAGVAISTTSRSSNTVTVTTSAVHGLTSGDLVNVNGVADTSFNGYFTASVSSTTVFTYSQTGADGSSTGGTSTEVVYNLNASGTALNWMNGPLNIAANSGIDGLEITQSGAGNGLHVTGTTGLVGNTTLTGNLDVSGTTLVTGVLTTTAATVFNGGFASNADSTLGTDKKVQFRDSAIYINSSADGQLDLVADTEIQIAATTVDLNGDLDVSGTTLVTGVLTTTAATVHTNGITMPDNAKAIFGAGSDLEIYHDASDSIINDNGTGSLKLQQGGSTKLEVTATGIDVTGSVTADGLTVDTDTLVVDATNNRVGIGTSSPDYTLDLGGATPVIRIGDAGSIQPTLTRNNSTGGLTYNTTGQSITSLIEFKDNGAERMRIDASGLVGIGTDSPASYYAAPLVVATSGVQGGITIANTTANKQGMLAFADGTAGSDRYSGYIDYNHSSNAMSFGTNGGSEKMRIDASGNVGIGTTSPSTFNQYLGNKKLVIGDGTTRSGVTIYSSNGASDFGALTFADGVTGTEQYRGAVHYQHDNDSMKFLTAATEAMRIDSSGNVGIGTSSPAVPLAISATTGAITTTSSTGTNIVYNAMLNSGGGLYLGLEGNTGGGIFSGSSAYDALFGHTGAYNMHFVTSNTIKATIDAIGNVGIGTSSPIAYGTGITTLSFKGKDASYPNRSGAIVFDSQSGSGGGASILEDAGVLYFSTGSGAALAATERMRIDASGSVDIIGAVSGTEQFRVGNSSGGTDFGITVTENDGVLLNAAEGATGRNMQFATGGTERMRIDASGNFFVGATALTANANFFGTSPGNAFSDFGHITGVASGVSYTRFLYAGSVIGSITQSGTIAVLYNTSSDQRLKENIADADDAGSKIDAIQVRKFDWKADGSHQDYGMIAQELQAVAPEAVSGDADSEEMMGVDYSKLVPMMLKEIQSLRARVSELES